MILNATLPPGWRPYGGPGVLLLATPPVDTGWFRTNLVVDHDRVAAGLDLRAHAQRALSALDELGDDVDVIGARHECEGTVERLVQVVEVVARRPAARLAQVQAFVVERTPGAPLADLAQFVGTCRFDELDRHARAFAHVVRSIGFADAHLS
jgi:hypothetical protein